MERLVLTMKQQNIQVPGLPTPQVAIAYIGERAKVRTLQLLTGLREAGIRAEMFFGDRSLRAQLRSADRANVSYALILGEDELASGQVVLQAMKQDVPQEHVSQADIVEIVKKRLCQSQD